MQAFRKTSPLAPPQHATTGANDHEASPEQNASGTSGTYFRAVRPSAPERDAIARGEPVINCAKVEVLRFELEVGIWRRDSLLIAGRVLDDAERAVDDADGDAGE
jgi:hypothetical protein